MEFNERLQTPDGNEKRTMRPCLFHDDKGILVTGMAPLRRIRRACGSSETTPILFACTRDLPIHRVNRGKNAISINKFLLRRIVELKTYV